ncbi:hypothetical protein [Streptomyces virginiae]|uniref:hypothetical protein n=1 Tax=Streptomyces virginiae TaxID=1961 RepID=UPI0036FCAC7B
MEPGYAWPPQLMQGCTAREIRGFAASARAENLTSPVGATQQVGTGRPPAGCAATTSRRT